MKLFSAAAMLVALVVVMFAGKVWLANPRFMRGW